LSAHKIKTLTRRAMQPKKAVSLMPKHSNESKQQWNAAHYTQVKASVNPDVAAAFKVTCAAQGDSIASVLTKFMIDFSQDNRLREQTAKSAKDPNNDPYNTRKKRRAVVSAILLQMNAIMEAEERYRDSVPENLHGTKWHEASEEVSLLFKKLLILLPIYIANHRFLFTGTILSG